MKSMEILLPKRLIYSAFILFNLTVIQTNVKGQVADKKNNIVLINSKMFDKESPVGVVKYITVKKTLENEIKVKQNEVSSLQTQLKKFEEEIRKDNSSSSTKQTKINNYETLEKEIKRKNETYIQFFNKRSDELLIPIQQKIGMAIKQWSLLKSITVLIDVSKDNSGLLLLYDEENVDVTTKELIKYLNSVL